MNPTPSNNSAARQTRNYPPSERRDVAKNEYLEGRLVAKPAANRWHNLIATNFAVAVGSRVHRGTCLRLAGFPPPETEYQRDTGAEQDPAKL